ncbi:MAG: hypothetical protein ACRDNK_05040 [Solirubrobacteraceae bacterium]
MNCPRNRRSRLHLPADEQDSEEDKTLASAASIALVRHQMRRISRGKHPTGKTHQVPALVCDQRTQRRALRRHRAWLAARV